MYRTIPLRLRLLSLASLLVTGCGAQPVAVDLGDASVAPSARLRAGEEAALTTAAKHAVERDALRLTEHRGAWTAAHLTQGFSTRIDARGASLQGLDAPAWRRAGPP
jgi:hypothetical protein